MAAGAENEQAAAIHAVNLKTEYLENPMGIDTESPMLSWEVDSQQRAQVQSAYQIQVTAADGALVWDSGKVDSNETTGIEYGFNGGEALAPMQRYTWRVQVWDGFGRASGWSGEASFETGLSEEQWETASWIGKAASVQQPEALNLETANWIWVLNGTDYKYVPAETKMCIRDRTQSLAMCAYLHFLCIRKRVECGGSQFLKMCAEFMVDRIK